MTEQEKQQQLKREFEKDSTLVTPSMRDLHFEKFGIRSDDKVILAWHNSNKVTSEMRELHRKEFGIAGAYDSDAQILAWHNSQLKEHPTSKAYQEAIEIKDRPKVKHYLQGSMEPIDFINSHGLNFNLGNAVKYITRCNHKGSKKEDLQKAIDYLKFELELL